MTSESEKREFEREAVLHMKAAIHSISPRVETWDWWIRRPLWVKLPRTEVALLLPERWLGTSVRTFGWYWMPTRRVHHWCVELAVRGHSSVIWDTPQFRAVEWLVGFERIPFPPDNDDSLHDVFCSIARLIVLATPLADSGPLTMTDISDAKDEIDKALLHLDKVGQAISAMPVSARVVLATVKSSVGVSRGHLNPHLTALYAKLGAMRGYLEGAAELRADTARKLGAKAEPRVGRGRNFLADEIALSAAEIYGIAQHGFPIRNDGRPSFRDFLERFATGMPGSDSMDFRRMARLVWDRAEQPSRLESAQTGA